MRICVCLILILLSSISCSTVATRENGETLRITGLGKAAWPDGATIEGKPLVELPIISIR